MRNTIISKYFPYDAYISLGSGQTRHFKLNLTIIRPNIRKYRSREHRGSCQTRFRKNKYAVYQPRLMPNAVGSAKTRSAAHAKKVIVKIEHTSLLAPVVQKILNLYTEIRKKVDFDISRYPAGNLIWSNARSCLCDGDEIPEI